VELDVEREQHDRRYQQLGADAENRLASHATASCGSAAAFDPKGTLRELKSPTVQYRVRCMENQGFWVSPFYRAMLVLPPIKKAAQVVRRGCQRRVVRGLGHGVTVFQEGLELLQ
jgi:hypothetical protein